MSRTEWETDIAIVGGGIAGLSLALFLQQNQIHSTIFEKDASFNTRSQGYGLTLQQGGRALKKINNLLESLRQSSKSSNSHFIFNSKGELVVFWGIAVEEIDESNIVWNGKRNLHISRQSLRRCLLDLINPKYCTIKWGYSFTSFIESKNFVKIKCASQDGDVEMNMGFLAGCDGIYSKVRHYMKLETDGLKFLDIFVMLGIVNVSLLDPILFKDRVIQMSNGSVRIFMMPFDEGRYMWQLSFPMSLKSAIELSNSTQSHLKTEAIDRCRGFSLPIPEILECTADELITGYPVYDRDPLESLPLNRVTLLGDACHSMSPFKGQGANQALLDAYDYSVALIKVLNGDSLETIKIFENAMLLRTKPKVLGSRESCVELHQEDFIISDKQLERRGFFIGNNLQTITNLKKMQADGVGIRNSELLDVYAFAPLENK
jgi:2-polyprenyl-6-methoxyphenol hydroxylase-like FAD-dependent oxidoreductase